MLGCLYCVSGVGRRATCQYPTLYLYTLSIHVIYMMYIWGDIYVIFIMYMYIVIYMMYIWGVICVIYIIYMYIVIYPDF